MHLSRRCTPGGNSRRSATKISRTCNKDPCSRPLRLVCHSFTSCIYLTIQGKDGIRSSLSDTCTKRSRGEPYNFIGPIRGDSFHRCTNIVATEVRSVSRENSFLYAPWITNEPRSFFRFSYMDSRRIFVGVLGPLTRSSSRVSALFSDWLLWDTVFWGTLNETYFE